MVGCKVDGPKAVLPVYIDSIHTFVLHSINSYILMFIPSTFVPGPPSSTPSDRPLWPKGVHFRLDRVQWIRVTTWALWQCLTLNAIALHVWPQTRTDIGYASPLNSDDDLPKPLIKPIFLFFCLFQCEKSLLCARKVPFSNFFIFLNPPSTCSYHSNTDSYLESKC